MKAKKIYLNRLKYLRKNKIKIWKSDHFAACFGNFYFITVVIFWPRGHGYFFAKRKCYLRNSLFGKLSWFQQVEAMGTFLPSANATLGTAYLENFHGSSRFLLSSTAEIMIDWKIWINSQKTPNLSNLCSYIKQIKLINYYNLSDKW